jgi:hypothetical protein
MNPGGSSSLDISPDNSSISVIQEIEIISLSENTG